MLAGLLTLAAFAAALTATHLVSSAGPTTGVDAPQAALAASAHGQGSALATQSEICTSSSGCEFWDLDYHQYILYETDTPSIDVLIVPPVSPETLWQVPVLEKSVDAWESGINTLAPSWLASGLNIHRYTLGSGVPPLSALQDPEIIIVSAEYNPVVLFGIGEQIPGLCTGGSIASVSAPHSHGSDGPSMYRVGCSNGGSQCVVLNTNFLLGGDRRLYDLNSHEFGHCLGIGHVGDALDFDARTVPMSDIMSYQDNPNQVHCVSSLDVKSLQGVYADLLGQSSGFLPAGSYVTMKTSDYNQVSCPNP